MKRTLVAAFSLALVASSVSSCTTPSAKPIEEYLSQKAVWVECDESLFVEAEGQSDVFKSLTPECATVVVPATYEGSSPSPEFGIQMMKISKAQSSDYKGILFINPGGPGGSGIEQLQWSPFPEEILSHYDIVGFDPRGVGVSQFTNGSEIKCSDALDYRTYFEGEGSPANFDEYMANIPLSDEYITDCVERNPFWWTLSTANVVADLEVIRQVITGDEDLNFIGTSYGTTIAGLYVSTYPDRVGKIVLDSPTTVDTDPIESAIEDYKAMESKLNIYLDYYADEVGKSSAEAWADLLYIKELADNDKLIGYAGLVPSPERPEFMISSESLISRGIVALNYFPEQDAKEEFSKAMQEALDYNSNWAFEFYALSMDGYDPEFLQGETIAKKKLKRSNEFEVMTIVNSMDYSPEDLSIEDQKKLLAKMKKVAPKTYALGVDSNGYQYFGESLGLDWATIARNNDSIPDPPTVPLVRENKSGKKLLIVGSMFESVTPYKFSKDTAKLLKSPLVSVESSIHGPAAGYDNSCLNKVLVDFFVNDITPEDMTCKS